MRRFHYPTHNTILSDLEKRCVLDASEGMTNREISRKEGLTEVSVRSCMSRAFHKLGSRNRTEAAITLRNMLIEGMEVFSSSEQGLD